MKIQNTQKLTGKKLYRRRILTIGVFTMLSFIPGIWIAGSVARDAMKEQYPAPGRRIDIGGYALHLHGTGQSGPTVVLESGAADFSIMWDIVQNDLSAFARVYSYDRAGLGWSDRSPMPRTAEVMANELHLLLENAKLEKPYILVGHSLGGLIVKIFASRFPEEVAGVVLVDAAHEGQFSRMTAELLRDYRETVNAARTQFQFLDALSGAGFLSLVPGFIPPRENFCDSTLARYRSILATTGYFHAASEELQSMEEGFSDVQNRNLIRIGDIPIVVIRRGREDALPGLSQEQTAAYEGIWRTLQEQTASLSPRSVQMVAEKSGHYIHRQQPEIIVDAVRRIAGMH